jgi:hypothetical protein
MQKTGNQSYFPTLFAGQKKKENLISKRKTIVDDKKWRKGTKYYYTKARRSESTKFLAASLPRLKCSSYYLIRQPITKLSTGVSPVLSFVPSCLRAFVP